MSRLKRQQGPGTPSDSTKKKKPKMDLSDSIRKYDGEMNDAAESGDVKEARRAGKKLAGFADQYYGLSLKKAEQDAKANSDSAKKYGPYGAAMKGKLKDDGNMFYGAEISDTAKTIKAAKANAAKKASSGKKKP